LGDFLQTHLVTLMPGQAGGSHGKHSRLTKTKEMRQTKNSTAFLEIQ
jgi:hypothetical protein